jgi:hypothetical protein
MPKDYVEIPVLLSFNSQERIGIMRIDSSRLPAGDKYVFALGVQVLKFEENARRASGLDVVEAKLRYVALLSDQEFLAYLKANGLADKSVPQ